MIKESECEAKFIRWISQYINAIPTNSNSNLLDNYRQCLLKSIDIAEKYHQNEINSIRKLITNVLWFIWFLGFTSVTITVIFAFTKNTARVISTPIYGTVIELFSGIIIKQLNGTLRSKESFFKQDMDMQKLDKILGLILTINNTDHKFTLIDKIVDNYIKNTDNNTDLF